MISDIKTVLLGVLDEMSVSGFAIGVGFENSEPKWAHSTYSTDWVNHYVKENLMLSDPTILHGQMNIGHLSWAQLEARYPDNAVFSEARRFGLSEGNTISVKIAGSTTVASCSGPLWTDIEIKNAKAAISGLHQIELPTEIANPLSGRSMAVLQLMSEGCVDRVIADRLHIKIETVRQRRNSAYQATGTTTGSELISHVIKNGWI